MNKKIIIPVVALVAVGAIGGGVYYYVNSKPKDTPIIQSSSSESTLVDSTSVSKYFLDGNSSADRSNSTDFEFFKDKLLHFLGSDFLNLDEGNKSSIYYQNYMGIRNKEAEIVRAMMTGNDDVKYMKDCKYNGEEESGWTRYDLSTFKEYFTKYTNDTLNESLYPVDQFSSVVIKDDYIYFKSTTSTDAPELNLLGSSTDIYDETKTNLVFSYSLDCNGEKFEAIITIKYDENYKIYSLSARQTTYYAQITDKLSNYFDSEFVHIHDSNPFKITYDTDYMKDFEQKAYVVHYLDELKGNQDECPSDGDLCASYDLNEYKEFYKKDTGVDFDESVYPVSDNATVMVKDNRIYFKVTTPGMAPELKFIKTVKNEGNNDLYVDYTYDITDSSNPKTLSATIVINYSENNDGSVRINSIIAKEK